VTTQPYDKISPEMEQRYLASDPHNVVRLIRPHSNPPSGKDGSVYAHAARVFDEWKREGIVRQVPEPVLFAYYQRFRLPGSPAESRTRKGLICLTEIEDYSNRVVFPHERTLSGPKQDRLELLRETRTHFGQVFLLYSDPGSTVDGILDDVTGRGDPLSIHDEYGVEHCLWPVTSPETIGAIRMDIAGRQMIIADGHHRYETALAFRDEERRRMGSDAPTACDWVMTTLVNMDSPGMTVLPTHRVLSGFGGPDSTFGPDALSDAVSPYFEISPVSVESLASELETRGAARPTIGVSVAGAGPVLLELRPEVDLSSMFSDVSAGESRLDVVVLHRLVFDTCLGISAEDVRSGSYLRFVRGLDEAMKLVGEDAQAAFLLNATRLDQVRDIALAGGVLPQKSTDFFPKLLSGLTMHSV
jgi:uncharacterized protein (DUF1015 family)